MDPVSSAPRFLEIMEAFSEISGYKINCCKSEVMPVFRICYSLINKTLQFKWIDSGMQYLGSVFHQILRKQINFFPLPQLFKTN